MESNSTAHGWSRHARGRHASNPTEGPARLRPAYDHRPQVTDASWKAAPSSVSHLGGRWGDAGFGGDALNDSRRVPGWATAGLDDAAWAGAAPHPLPAGVAVSADAMEPTTRHGRVRARSVSARNSSAGAQYVVRMAELFTGWFEVANMTGAPGSTVHSGFGCAVALSDRPSTP